MAQLHAVITLIGLWNLLVDYILWPLVWRWTVEGVCVVSRHESGQKTYAWKDKMFSEWEMICCSIPDVVI